MITIKGGSHEIALEIIARRRWRNGYLVPMVKKALAGHALDRELDTDLSEKEWEEINGRADRKTAPA